MESQGTKENRRERIVRAARAEFAGRGLAGGRTARIAERAGVNKQLIFYYFGSKRALYEAVVRSAGGSLRDRSEPEREGRAAAQRTPADRVRSILHAVYRTLDQQPELVGLLVRGIGDPSPARGALADFISGLIAELSRVISEGQGLGYFRDDVDPGQAATQAVVLAIGYLPLETVLASGPAPERRADWLHHACNLLLESLAW